MEIIKLILIVVGGSLGALSSIGVVLLLFGTIIFKIFRKIRYGISLFD